MKTLVTGATGFIGSSLVRELLKDSVEVRVLVRENSDTRNIDGLDVEKAYGDIRDGEAVKAALKGCDTFYQTAALYAFWAPDSKVFYEINVEGTKIALNVALEQGVEKVVYTSTAAAIGRHGSGTLANEESQFNLWYTGDHYMRSKYLGEVEAKKICEKGLPLVIVNPSGVIGVRDVKPTPSGKIILDVVTKKMPGYIDGGMNFVDVEDVALGHILAAQKGRIGERYILGNENLSLRDYLGLIADVGGVKPPRLKMPYPVAIAMGYLFGFAASITRKPPLMTPAVVRAGKGYFYFDVSKAVNELGMPQTPVRTTIEKAFNWFRENGYVKGA
ncbi:MAG: NAD-dependent epimerase/dehydratase family protein [Desulfobacterales bacterium]|nr:NAD-dependent epimerase/dehydratase family protein [Desulfobacterales bacterium]